MATEQTEAQRAEALALDAEARVPLAPTQDEGVYASQECRDCHTVFPYDPDADRCPDCAAIAAGGVHV